MLYTVCDILWNVTWTNYSLKTFITFKIIKLDSLVYARKTHLGEKRKKAIMCILDVSEAK